VSVIGVVGLVVGCWPILKEAFENILERRMTMELSMTIAIVAAAAIGQFFTALIITLFCSSPRCWRALPWAVDAKRSAIFLNSCPAKCRCGAQARSAPFPPRSCVSAMPFWLLLAVVSRWTGLSCQGTLSWMNPASRASRCRQKDR
jgi:hypothetical protein